MMFKQGAKNFLRVLLLEAGVYAALVAVYCFLVLHFLGPWLARLFHDDRRAYAFAALGLIIAQGFLLELLTRFMLARVKPRAND
jgi:hypothetical protein